jgi:hypothetical protein
VNAYAISWHNVKDTHFIVYYNFVQDQDAARTVLRKAEEYYKKIADQVGYTRYSRFWTWEERVKIIIFPTHEAFIASTGQPEWSRGYADRYSNLFRSRVIVTYRQEKDFIDGLLPHEISHLILWDFIGFNTAIPIWFDEGVAQLQEAQRKERSQAFLKPLVRRDNYVPFDFPMRWDIRTESDPEKVKFFYSQSVLIIDFLLRRYGSTAFGNLCRNLKAGKSMEDSLRSAYYPSIKTIEDFEKKWVEYMKR